MLSAKRVGLTPIVEIEIDGPISEQEFDEALEILREAIEDRGSIRVLKYVKSMAFPPLPVSRLWDDARFAVENLADVSHIAAVTDIPGIDRIVRVMNPLFRPEVRSFSSSQLTEARRWLRSPDPESDSVSHVSSEDGQRSLEAISS